MARASPVHVEEYLAVSAVARDLPAAALDPRLDVETLLAEAAGDAGTIVPFGGAPARPGARPARDATRRYWLRTAAAALLLAGAAAAIWQGRDGQRLGLAVTYATARAEQRVLQLPDGSVLHLNTDSAATVRFSGTERVVSVERGQAYFEVMHEAGRRSGWRLALRASSRSAPSSTFIAGRGMSS